MASKKVTITKIYENNAKNPTTIPSTTVESEVIDGRIVELQTIVKKGVTNNIDR